MAVYTYQGRGSAGATAGEIEAADRTSAVGELAGAPFSSPRSTRNPAARPRRSGGKVKDKEWRSSRASSPP